MFNIRDASQFFPLSLSLSLLLPSSSLEWARCCLYFTGNFKYFAVKSFRHMQSSSACICERGQAMSFESKREKLFWIFYKYFSFCIWFHFLLHSQFFFPSSQDETVNTTSRSELSFVPSTEDDGKSITCRAENPKVTGLFLETTWKLNVVCKYTT